jgi:hypothetical protein
MPLTSTQLAEEQLAEGCWQVTARSPAHPDDPRHLLAADHHPAEGLAATGTSACDRRG